MLDIAIKRAYDPAAKSDGFRVLVDRVWPRGVSKERLKVRLWAKEIAPSTRLRRWFGHDPERWREFRKRYEAELRDSDAGARLRAIAREARDASRITLVYGAKDAEHNQAVVLRDAFERLAR
jgi:uncharacterized protein YeaO (DUF488 family)